MKAPIILKALLTAAAIAGGAWLIALINTPAARVLLHADQTYYVSQDGSDLDGNGSRDRPWLSLQWAGDYIAANLDLGRHNVTVKVFCRLRPCTLHSGVQMLRPFVGNGWVTFEGDDKELVTIDGGHRAAIFNSTMAGGAFKVRGFKCESNITARCLYASAGGLIRVSGPFEFGNLNTPESAHSLANMNGNITIEYPPIYSGSAGYAVWVTGGGAIEFNVSGDVAVKNNPNFRRGFAVADHGSILACHTKFKGNATGARQFASGPWMIQTCSDDPHYFPGSQ